MGIASLVLGIFSILFAFTGPAGFIGILLGAAGIVLAVLARKKDPADGVATGGLITSIVGCALALLFYMACLACVAGSKKVMDEASKDPRVSKSIDDFTSTLKKMEEEANRRAEKGN